MWRAFWLYWILPLVAANLYEIALQIPPVTQWIMERHAGSTAADRVATMAITLIILTIVGYLIFAAVAVWRSASRFAGPRYAAWVVKACLVSYALYYASGLLSFIGIPAM